MKQVLAFTLLLQFCNSCLFAQNSNAFNTKKFENELISEMHKQFPFMTLDTTLSYAAKATSQKAAGNPTCYGTKKGGMVDTANNEKDEALRLVNSYRNYLSNILHFDEKSLIRCGFTEFCATATEENGRVRYGLIVDNNIDFNN